MKASLILHFLAGWLLVIAVLALVCFYVPGEDAKLGSGYLIFFFHFPSSFTCLLLFAGGGVAGMAYLATGSPAADRAGRAAIEVGLLACTIAMVTGAIWAKQAWGRYWRWEDPRLTTVAVMWLTYLGYLALRSAIDAPVKRARFGAVFAIIALVNLPLVHFAIRWFGEASHPPKIDLDPSMRITMWAGAAAFLVLYGAFWRLRFRLAGAVDRAGRIEEEMILKGA